MIKKKLQKLYIYNYILENVEYDDVEFVPNGGGRVVAKPGSRNISAYGALIKGKAVCSGISDAVYLLCSSMGLECKKVLSATNGHAYNFVKVNNQWYSLDATYEINRFLGGKILENRFKDNFFLKQGSINHSRIGNFLDLSDCNAPEDMPRESINEVKGYLELKGVSFNYTSSDITPVENVTEGLRLLLNQHNVMPGTIDNLVNTINSLCKKNNNNRNIRTPSQEAQTGRF